DGQLSGQAGQLAFYLGASWDRGRWWISSDQLCHKWNHWFNSEPQCLRLKQEGRRLRWWTKDGTSGTAVITGTPSETAALRPQAAAQALPTPAQPAPLAAPPPVPPEQRASAPGAPTLAERAMIAAVPSPAPVASAPSPQATLSPASPAEVN